MTQKIILASHGRYAQELVRSAEMIVGQVKNVSVLFLEPEMSMEDFMKEAVTTIETTGGDEPIIALVDLFGGTPSNVLTALTKSYPLEVVTGASLPMFIDLYLKVQNGEKDVEDLVNECLGIAEEATVHTNKVIQD